MSKTVISQLGYTHSRLCFWELSVSTTYNLKKKIEMHINFNIIGYAEYKSNNKKFDGAQGSPLKGESTIFLAEYAMCGIVGIDRS